MATPQKLRCLVSKITDHGDHVYTVDLAPERPLPRFRPGQFLHLTLDDYDPSGFWPESRVFSIASSASQRNDLRISYSVRGRYTTRMENELHEGQWVWVKLPYGDFVIRDANNVALLASGTGITAFIAFIDGLTNEFHNNIFLAYGARKPELLLYRDLIDGKTVTNKGFHASYFVETDDKDTETLLFPEEVIVGHRGRFIAHKRYGDHLIRAVYEYDANLPVLITVYYPRPDRYFEGGEKYADKIFQRS